MAARPDCPDVSRIRAMLDGALSEEEQVALAKHLEQCEECQNHFERLATGDEVLPCPTENLKRAQGRPPETAVQRLVQDLHDTGTDETAAPEQATPGEPSLDFLAPSDAPDHLGRLGSYEITEIIGQGGMGIVLKGHDTRLNRCVAIKVLSPALAANPVARNRFMREAQAAAAISHDHVVTIHAVDEASNLPFLTMEFIDGVSLDERIKRSGPLQLKEILRIGMQAASGLAAAHAQGLVHRDIKPSNILLENGVERVKITDFGLARAADDIHFTQTGVIAGTPEYMSPEQARGEPTDHRSDLFSLGCVMYAMCTGRSPFRAETVLGVIHRVCDDTPRPIRQVNAEIPEWLAEIVDRLLQKEPDKRFQLAAEVADLLGRDLAHLQQPSLAPKPRRSHEPAEIPRQPSRRKRPRFLLAVAASVVLLTGFILTEATGVTNVAEYAVTVLRLATPHGTLVVKIDDPHVNVSVDGDEGTITLTGIGEHEIKLRPGRHSFQAMSQGKVVQRDWVTITRGDRRVVTIEAEVPPPPKPDAVVGQTGELEVRIACDDIQIQVEGEGVSERMAKEKDKDFARALAVPPGVYEVEVRNTRIDQLLQAGKVAVGPGDKCRIAPNAYWETPPIGPQRKADQTFSGHKLGTKAYFSPDGATLLTASHDGAVVLREFDGKEWQSQRVIPRKGGKITDASFSPDGTLLAISCSSGTVEVWDAKAAKLRKLLAGHEESANDVAFSPDGTLLASASSDNTVRLWDVASWAQHARLVAHSSGVHSVAFSPDGAVLATASWRDSSVRLWRIESLEEFRTLNAHTSGVSSIAFSPDGTMLASTGHDSLLVVWDMKTGKPRRTFRNDYVAFYVDFSPSGDILAVADQQVVRLWNCAEWKVVAEFHAHWSGMLTAVFSPDGKRLATAGGDCLVKVWNLGQLQARSTDVSEPQPKAAFRLWCSARFAPLFAFSPSDTTALAVASYWGKDVEIWDLDELCLRKTFRAYPKFMAHLSFASDGSLVTCGYIDDNVRAAKLWSRGNYDEMVCIELPMLADYLAIYPNKRTFAALRRDSRPTRLWSVDSGKETVVLPTRFRDQECGAHSTMALSPDGSILAISTMLGFVALCDAATGECLADPLTHGERTIWDVAFSRDGKMLATASGNSTVKLWDLTRADAPEELKTLHGHTEDVLSVAFSPDGKLLVSAGGDAKWGQPAEMHHIAEVRLWNTETCELLVEFEGHAEAVMRAEFSPNGRTLATAGRDHKVYLWDVAELLEYGAKTRSDAR